MPHGELDFIRQSFADLREQFASLKNQLAEDTSSLAAQIRSLTGSINNHTTEVAVRLTAIEGWQKSHERLDDAVQEAASIQNLQRKAEVHEMAVQMGLSVGRCEDTLKKTVSGLEALQAVYQKVQGAGQFWRWTVGLGGAVLVLLNIVHLVGGK